MTKAQLHALPPANPADQSDQRGAKRATLLIRSAKLICQSGEYVCLVRDVSATGVRLRLFHTIPPETFVFLELGNGEIYPMEKKWSSGEEAGFRFTQPIDVESFINEPGSYPRRALRLRMEAQGQLFSEGRFQPIKLRDLSQGGARIETTTWLALLQPVRLLIPGLPERTGQVRWRDRYEHGLAFQQTLRLDDFARHAGFLQPFTPSQPTASAETLIAQPARANG